MKFSILQILVMTALVALWLYLGSITQPFIGWLFGRSADPTSVVDYLFGPLLIICFVSVPVALTIVAVLFIAGAWCFAGYVSGQINVFLSQSQEPSDESYSDSGGGM
jgi:hypothetical protein